MNINLKSICLLVGLLILIFSSSINTEVDAADENEPCMVCHGRVGFGKDLGNGNVRPLYIDKSEINESIHKNQSCIACHVDATEIPHSQKLSPVNCEYCHYKGNPNGAPNVGQFKAYEDSVHGKLAQSGDKRAPRCKTCHGTHKILARNDPKSTIYKLNVPILCANCHAEVYEKYIKGAHGRAIEKGIMDAAACNDCHGTHSITRTGLATYQAGIADTCAKCHSSKTLIKKYGLPTGRVRTYRESFHGEANKYGSISAANCSSCHGAHDILPASDPKSTINKNNLPATCGKSGCHPNSSKIFATGTFHVELIRPTTTNYLGLIRIGYTLLIIGVVGGMIVHDLFDFRSRRINRKNRASSDSTHDFASPEETEHSESSDEWTSFSEQMVAAIPAVEREELDEYEWMPLSERVQHIVLLASFTVLAITGFAVYIPAGWVEALGLKSEIVFNIRGLIHRIAAIIMILDGIYHVYHILATRRGRWELKELFPKLQDLKDITRMVKYYLGRSNQKPLFGRFSYKEKMEYWALIWGTLVMAATGTIVWAKTIWPKWTIDISTVIHSYEAVLAVLSVFAWHFYNVHWAPGKFPMDKSWLTGKISRHELIEEFPLEYERLQRMKQKNEKM